MNTLPEKVKQHLTTQIERFERLLGLLNGIDPSLDNETLSGMLEHINREVEETNRLEKQRHRLALEWKADPNTETNDRAAVRTLALQAEALAKEVAKAYENAGAIIQEYADGLVGTLGALRAGRNMLTKYRPSDAHDPWFIDKKA